ncbi:filamin-A-like isoform X2 [Anneissia japonica]|uniref:filamin-A-like isoform X2 n=1 Tax=Anneissia japonica TaxID=1529436 RepID=UPI0014257262|nr:filamin-A-like isoform X2 [Anneissia japonica]
MSSNGEAYEDCYYQDEIVEQKRELDEDEEMPLAEKDLADDAPWKKIQQNTFTRWCNEHLKVANKHIGGLETDLCDGLRLISLVEVLSQKRVGRFNKRPTFRSMKLENVSVVMSFLESKENIKIVNIDSSDIVDGRLKLILGLIWTLILHYSISMPMWDEEGEGAVDGQKKKKETPKEKLLGWIQSKVPDLPIKNFNKDWNDGRAVGALVDSCAPGLCPDWEDWDPANKLDNAREAMQLADDWLNVPQLLAPEDMVNPRVDDLSMMTYLSEFPKAKLKPGAPLRPRSNSKKVRAYGPGIEKEGNAITRPTHFTVETYAAGSGTVTVTIINPNGEIEPHEIKYNKDKNKSYTVEYTPRSVGTYTVKVAFNNTAIPKSPFTVVVGKLLTDPSKCSAEGPGLQPTGVMLDQSTYFEVFTAGAGLGELSVTVKDPNGDPTTSSVMLEDKGKGVFYCQYTPTMMGTYTIEITFSGANIPGSVFEVKVVPEFNPKNAFAYGRGIQNKGLRAKEKCVFYVDTKKAGEANLKVQIIGPGGIDEPVKVVDNGDGTFTCSYSPFKPGRYIVHIIYGKEHIPKSPFTVNISPEAQGPITNVRAFGPGLEKGVAGKPCTFTVETNGAVGALGFAIEGPSEAEIKCADNGDGSCEVTYYPTVPGEYAIHITFDEEDIEHSPYMAKITPDPLGFDAGKVVASGPGLKPDGLLINEKTEFTVDARAPGCGKAELEIFIFDQLGNKIQPDIRDNKNGTWTVSYTPTAPLKHSVAVTWGKVSVPKSPFRVTIGAGPGAVKLYGPGLESGNVKSKEPTEFTVDCTEAGKGPIQVKCTSAPGVNSNSETPIKCDVTDNKDGTYTARYTPQKPGNYVVEVKFKGKDVPQSPITVQVVPTVDVSKITIDGLQEPIQVGKEHTFFVNTAPAGPGDLEGDIKNPSGKKLPITITQTPKGHAVKFTPEEEGQHVVGLTYADVPLTRQAFIVQPKTDPRKVIARGRGLKGGPVNEPTDFSIDTRKAGIGGLNLTVEGPTEAVIDCKDHGDGTCKVTYTPNSIGPYKINVLFADEHIPGSPFNAKVYDPSKVKAYGPGLEPAKSFATCPCTFKVDARDAGEPPMKAQRLSPDDASYGPLNGDDLEVNEPMVGATEKGPGDFSVQWPKEPSAVNEDPVMADRVLPVRSAPGSHGPENGILDDPFSDFHRPHSKGSDTTDNAPVAEDVIESTQLKPKKFGHQWDDLDKPVNEEPVSYQEGKPTRSKKLGPVDDFPVIEEALSASHVPPVECSAVGPDGKPLDVDVKDNGDGTYDVTYFPTEEGPIDLDVKYGDHSIPNFPLRSEVGAPLDVSGVEVFGYGIEPEVFVGCPTDFTVNAKAVGPQANQLKDLIDCTLQSPSGTKVKPVITDNKDGTYRAEYTPVEEGPHKLDVNVAGKPVGKSPYKVGSKKGCDPKKVKAFGPGLESGLTDAPAVFTIETKGAGQGGLGIAIEGPCEAEMKCVDNNDGSCTVEYMPTKPGEYDVHVTFADTPIPGSPFKPVIRDVVDPSKVLVSGPGVNPVGVRANVPAPFQVDATKAGKAPLECTILPERAPKEHAQVYDNEDGTFDCSYVPKNEGRKCAVEVKYDGKHVPGSPFNTRVLPQFDASKVKVSGPGVQPSGVLASLPVEFLIDTKEAGEAQLAVSIIDATGKPVKPTIVDNGDGTYTVSYTPKDIGPYTILITFGGNKVPGAPFSVSVSPTGDASKCQIVECKSGGRDIPVVNGETITKTVVVEEETVIKINSQDAGQGMVTCAIMGPDGVEIEDVQVIDNGDGTFDIVWTCPVSGRYNLDMKFGGMPITGGPISIGAGEGPPEEEIIPFEVQGVESAAMPQECRPFDLVLPLGGIGQGRVHGEVTTPTGKKHKPQITENKDGTITVKYAPTETGLHHLNVMYNNQCIPGSPFQFHVDEIKSGQATAYGPGLTHGICEQPCHFIINTKDAGPGGVALAVEGPSKAEIKCKDNKDGTCDVTYYPLKPGDYALTVKFADKHVPGSPFTAKIVDKTGAPMCVGACSDIPLKINETDLSLLTASIKMPSGCEENCQLKRLPNQNIGITFTPREVGEHAVSVKKFGRHITNSPFKIIVGSQEVGDASKVKVSGLGIAEGDAGEIAEFKVDTSKAGFGGLGVSIEGPSKTEINCEDNGDGTCIVTYKPQEPGNYILNVKYADQHVPGSPFKVKVHGKDGEMVTETLVRPRLASPVSHIGNKCDLGLKVPGSDPLDMTAHVTNPEGKTDDAEIIDGSDCRYTVRFVPEMMGVHTISVKHKGMHIPGSPFQFTVGPFGEGGAHKVHAGGLGLERGEVNTPAEFTVWTREAGPGSLGIAVEGPAKAEINFTDNKDGSCQVAYVPTEQGEYVIKITYNDEPIPDSPFRPFIQPSLGEARRVSVTSLQETGLKANQPASFAIQLNGAKGEITAKVVSPTGTEEECLITEIDRDNFAVRFLPHENGIHMIHVNFREQPIAGSPFRVRVGTQAEVGDPGMVHASGDGLEKGKTGQPCEFVVNTCGAGTGVLSISVDGPSKVKMDVTEVPEGYKCSYVPTAPGDYLISIKFAGAHHIVGSPYKARITGPAKTPVLRTHETSNVIIETVTKTQTSQMLSSLPHFHSNASKVTSTGMGLKKAFRNKRSQFTVNAADAGHNMLMVGIAGPKTPCEEILVKHNGRNRFIVNYTLKDIGEYMLVVKWGDEHIPGSPFHIKCSV